MREAIQASTGLGGDGEEKHCMEASPCGALSKLFLTVAGAVDTFLLIIYSQ